MRTTPRDTGQPRKMWAKANGSGVVQVGGAGFRVSRLSAGAYSVTFERALASATAYGVVATAQNPSFFSAVVQTATGAGFNVITFPTTTGTNTDSDFTVEVTTPVY